DNRLRAKVADTTSALTDLPLMAVGGLLIVPSPSARFAAAAAWRSWSKAGAGAFDTWSWSAGAEFGSRRMPIRLGARGGQVPFGPGLKAPTEVAGAVGTGRAFRQGRACGALGRARLGRR